MLKVEGAFMQGMGLFTMEQCVYLEGSKGAQRGQLFTTGPGTYKIPSCQDIPVDFRVELLGRAPNPKAIFSSKVRNTSVLILNCLSSPNLGSWRATFILGIFSVLCYPGCS